MNDNFKELLKLAKKHPQLPIIPIVDSEVVADADHDSWMASFGKPAIIKFIAGDQDIHFYNPKDPAEVSWVIEDVYGEGIAGTVDENTEKRMYEALKWVEVIAAVITLPETDKYGE